MSALARLDFATGGRLSRTWNRGLLSRLERTFADLPFGFTVAIPGEPDRLFGLGPSAFRLVLRDGDALVPLASLDEGRIAEAYMDGAFDVQGDILRMLDLRARLSDHHPAAFAWRFLQPLLFGQIRANAAAIRKHYDLDAELYLSFLDETRCYTQGIFLDREEPLAAAIHRKFDFAIDACGLTPGSHLLEVGPGWGAFTEYATRRDIRVTAVTNSKKSKEFVEDLGGSLGLRWDVVLSDILEYRPGERYDAVVLMGIMEHLPDYPAILARLQALVKPGGHVYLDASATRVKFEHSSFIYRHIYPANHSFLALHDLLAAVAKTPLHLRSVHDDRENYHLTFLRWARRFERNRDAVVRRFGEREYRRFHLYLWGSAHCFLVDTLQCYRVVLTRPGPGTF
jgi:cyclopropane-fatty-acyl-phospholipid synthase